MQGGYGKEKKEERHGCVYTWWTRPKPASCTVLTVLVGVHEGNEAFTWEVLVLSLQNHACGSYSDMLRTVGFSLGDRSITKSENVVIFGYRIPS